MTATRQIIFKIGTEEYGFDVQLVNAIESYTNIVPVPNAPRCVLGLMNLRGDVIPVYSLRKKFGQPELASTETTKLIVTRNEEMLLAFKVDEVTEILDFEEQQLADPPTIIRSANTGYIKKIAHQGGRMILLLDHAAVLNGEEEEEVKQLLEQQGASEK